MDGKVDVTMKVDAQGFKKGETVNCTDLRAVRWCDIMGIAERGPVVGRLRPKKEKKREVETD